MNHSKELNPMSFWMSLPFFGIPTVVGVLGVYVVLPALDRAGHTTVWTYNLTLYGVLPLLLLAALIAYRLEGRTLSLAGLRDRFRIGRLGRREWLWTAGLLVVCVGGYLLLTPTQKWLATVLPFAIPDALPPVVDPRIELASIPTSILVALYKGTGGLHSCFS